LELDSCERNVILNNAAKLNQDLQQKLVWLEKKYVDETKRSQDLEIELKELKQTVNKT